MRWAFCTGRFMKPRRVGTIMLASAWSAGEVAKGVV